MTKSCSKCKTEKDIALFYKNKAMKTGFDNYCKVCREIQKKSSTPENYQKEYNKEYYSKNSLKIKKANKEYQLKNIEKCKDFHKKYYEINKETLLAKKRAYFQNNKESRNEYYRNKMQTDPVFLIRSRIRGRFNIALKRQGTQKKNKTMEYIGCSKEELKKYIELQFVDGMSWDNKGKWHIDHIKPLSSFDLSDEKQVFEAMNFRNLQPLWAQDNIRKSNKINV